MSKRNILWKIQTTMVTETCFKCGVLFGMEEGYQNQKRRDGTSFHCPNGHGQIYTDSDKKKIKRAEVRIRDLQQCCDDYMEEASHHERRFWGLKGHVAKLKKQKGNGACEVRKD